MDRAVLTRSVYVSAESNVDDTPAKGPTLLPQRCVRRV